jgi:hypothetical protein
MRCRPGRSGQHEVRQRSAHFRHRGKIRHHPRQYFRDQGTAQPGCYPSFAHDQRLMTAITVAARDHGWAPDQYEFEMLHGARPVLQRALARQGHRIRAYLPFGTDWFPYAVRRIGESPATPDSLSPPSPAARAISGPA